jgi:Bacterial membrane protein YfhO
MNRLKEKILQKSNLWHVGAILFFIIVASIFFYPAWSGYNVEQGDVTNWVGASQEIKDYRESVGQPGWTNAMFSGMPSTQISMYYPGRNIPFFLRDVYSLWMPRPVSIMFIYFLSFYIMAMSFKMKPLVAILGAVMFGLSSSQIIIIEAGHLTKALAIGFAPLLIAGMIYAYRWKNWILGLGLSSLFMTFELSANHLQITYYMAFVLLALGLVELYRSASPSKNNAFTIIGTLIVLLGIVLSVFSHGTMMRIGLFILPVAIGLALLIKNATDKKKLIKFGKVSAGLGLAYGIALIVNMGNIIGTNEYAKFTTRGGTDLTITATGETNDELATSGLDREYITSWSYGKGETFTFIIPNFKGGETMRLGDNDANKNIIKDVPGEGRAFVKGNNQYWGNQPFTSGPVYLGIIVVLLALLGLIYSKDKFRWALLAVTILTVMLSWGKNYMGLTNFFLDNLPGYNKFRAVTIILAVAQLTVPLLGLLFLHRLVSAREKIKENIVPMYIGGGSLAFILLLFMATPSALTNFHSDVEMEQLDGIDLSTPQGEQTYDYYSDQYSMLADARASILKKDATRSFAMLVLAFGVILFFVRGAYSKYVMGGILALLVLIDLGGVDKRFLDTKKKGRNYEQWTETWKQQLPYNAGNADLQIFNLEAQANPKLLLAVDSALNSIDFDGMENKEKSRAIDWTKFRTLNRYTNYRVFDYGNPFNSSYASYFHKSIGGYHGAKLGRYQELIEFHIGNSNPAVLDMLNMKYKIASQRGQTGWNSQFVGENPSRMGNAWFTKSVKAVETADDEIVALTASMSPTLTIGETALVIFINGDSVSGKMKVTGTEDVYFMYPTQQADGSFILDTVRQTLPVQQAEAFDLSLIPGQQPGTWQWAYDEMLDTSIARIMTLSAAERTGWDPSLETIVGADFIDQVSQENYSAEGSIEMTSYHPDNLTYKSSSPDQQLAVFSEIHYPLGWKAYVDGEEVPISRVNYTLRAIEIPAGDHIVEFVYNLPSFEKSGTFAWMGSILMLIFIGAGVFVEIKRKDGEAEEESESDAEDKPETEIA